MAVAMAALLALCWIAGVSASPALLPLLFWTLVPIQPLVAGRVLDLTLAPLSNPLAAPRHLRGPPA